MKEINNYKDPKWVGLKFGHLTIEGHEHRDFIVRCDCGRVAKKKASLVAFGKVVTCGDPLCNYHLATYTDGRISQKRGEEFESELTDKLIAKGYEVLATPRSGDYGVDIIVKTERHRTAIQAKLQAKSGDKVGVKAVMEAYAGGHFYDCDQFAVVSKTGFTENAITMAKKLGVMLCDDSFTLLKQSEIDAMPKRRYLTINGETKTLYRWCVETGKDFKVVNQRIRLQGMTPEEAFFVEKPVPFEQICREHGMLAATVAYRMKKLGMTLEEALSVPKAQWGKLEKVNGEWIATKPWEQ